MAQQQLKDSQIILVMSLQRLDLLEEEDLNNQARLPQINYYNNFYNKCFVKAAEIAAV